MADGETNMAERDTEKDSKKVRGAEAESEGETESEGKIESERVIEREGERG